MPQVSSLPRVVVRCVARERPKYVVIDHRGSPPSQGNPAKRDPAGLLTAFRYALPAASRTASLALPTPLRM